MNELTRSEALAQLKAARNRADSPNATAADKAKILRLYDALPEVWRAQGDLAQYAQNDLVDHINAAWSVKEALKRKADELRLELGWERATAAEQLLIEQVVICWLRMQVQELSHTATLMSGDGVSLQKADHQERVLAMVQARYLRAIETLARVRRLLNLPTVQINVAAAGGQQVNVAGGA